MSDLEAQLSRIHNDYQPITSLARDFAGSGVGEDAGGTVRTGHEPERGSEAYAVTLFPGLPPEGIQRYEHLNGIEIPMPLKSLLNNINGAFLCEISIFGIPPSMINDPPLLDRSIISPLNLASAWQYWRAGFAAVKASEFYFAGRNVGYSSQIGYFLRSDGSVVSYPKRGTQYESQTWPSLEEWMHKEIPNMMTDRPRYLEECRIAGEKADRRYFWMKMLPWYWHRWFLR